MKVDTEERYDAYKRRRGVESLFLLIKDPGKQEMARSRQAFVEGKPASGLSLDSS
ncbi:MAG: hypothetical protein GWP04_10150 [Gammaproteobacteria bacterium]|nr:hypothetical protein [Gammaproteobacteria bacterium]